VPDVTARILVVDDVAANIRLMEARLQAEYFDVRTALSGRAALEMAAAERVDLVLLDVMMPDMTGYEVCAALKADPRTAHVPVIMVTTLDQVQDRVRGLECGADDFLTKPVSDVALVTRVKSLVRLKMVADELLLRSSALQTVGFDSTEIFAEHAEHGSRILVIDDRENSTSRIRQALADRFHVEVTSEPAEAVDLTGNRDFDLLIVSLSLQNGDGLRLCSQIKSQDRVRHTPVLLVTDPDETAKLMRALEIGINDYIIRPIDGNELRARVRTQLRRKLYAERLRGMVSDAMELAITDPLTGLYNRRYLQLHLKSLIARAITDEKPICVLLFDIDHFKGVNDTYGHDVGDEVLKDFSDRLRRGVRGIDLVARLGGEEFILVMPETDASYAAFVAERLRSEVENGPFRAKSGARFPMTVSIGLAEWHGASDTAEALVKRADQALYAAKRAGRNRVVASAA
jgi:two-component system, cell cycle response regulator